MGKTFATACVLALWVVGALGKAPSADELSADYSYSQYLKDFGQKTSSEEGKTLFQQRLKEILAHNAHPGVTYKRGVNQFTDVASPPKGRVASPGFKSKYERQYTYSGVDLPDSVDWRESGVVSPVKNQGHCGSCWAFATTETVESHIALATGKLFSLSPQQLVACAPNDDHCGGYGGCLGSIPELAYDFLISAGGYAEVLPLERR